jgi:hypothetical protein
MLDNEQKRIEDVVKHLKMRASDVEDSHWVLSEMYGGELGDDTSKRFNSDFGVADFLIKKGLTLGCGKVYARLATGGKTQLKVMNLLTAKGKQFFDLMYGRECCPRASSTRTVNEGEVNWHLVKYSPLSLWAV